MMKFIPIILLTIFLTSCYNDNEEELYGLECDTKDLTYSKNIEKIISTSCAISGCHVVGNGRSIYDSYANLKKDVDNGTVLAKVITNKSMPPAGSLSECDYSMIEEWIKQGAKE